MPLDYHLSYYVHCYYFYIREAAQVHQKEMIVHYLQIVECSPL